MRGIEFNERAHRYRLDGKPVKGVTTLLSAGVPKGDALLWWAARETALKAHEHRLTLPEDEDACVALLRGAWREKRDVAAVHGTAVHSLAETLMTTGVLDDDRVDDVLDVVESQSDPTKFDRDEMESVLWSYIEGYAEFLQTWDITPLISEAFVASREHGYCGRFDLIASTPHLFDGAPFMLDLKTSGSVHGETALQCAAYARAEFYQTAENAPETPMPALAGAVVAHVTPAKTEADPDDHTERTGRYKGKPYGTSLYMLSDSPEQIDEHFGMFLHAAATAKTATKRKTTGPLAPPTTQGETNDHP